MKRSRFQDPCIQIFTCVTFFLLVFPVFAQDESVSDQDTIPEIVLETFNHKFPDAKINQWTKESEDDYVINDFEFEVHGKKLEADIREDGILHNWEKRIALDEIPPVVLSAIENKYRDYDIGEILQISHLGNGQDETEGFEIILIAADNTQTEITISPDGRILEDSGTEK